MQAVIVWAKKGAFKEYRCDACGATIERREQYYWWQTPFKGSAFRRCIRPSCIPASYELELNPKRRLLARAQHALEKAKCQATQEQALSWLCACVDEVHDLIAALDEISESLAGNRLELSKRVSGYSEHSQYLRDWLEELRLPLDDLEVPELEQWEAMIGAIKQVPKARW